VNLEGVLCDSGNPVDKKFTFRGPTDFVNILTQNSVEAVTLANNHSLDYGRNGYASTKATLEAAEMPYVEKQSTLLYTTESGLIIGIYAEEYTAMDLDLLKRSVAELREQGAELIVYAVHWGVEGHFYPQDHQIEYAHQVIDAGVDIIYGTHPHVLEPVEWVDRPDGGKMLVFYSLGNFISGQIEAPRLLGGMANVTLTETPEGTFAITDCSVIPVVTHYSDHVGDGTYTVYRLSEYTEDLLQLHGIHKRAEESVFTLEDTWNLAREILGEYLEE
jgi:poly-gamma-glutamate synthesis protein (capsule biosynthesis protein)